MIKVLWIDDQFAEQSLVDFAQIKYGIEIIPFGLRITGMEELVNNLDNYDAVILDAKMLDKSQDERPDTLGLINSIMKLKELNAKSFQLPFVIYTGQPDLYSDSQFLGITEGINVYKKGIDNDIMLKTLIQMSSDLPNTKIRIKYSRAFELCTDEYIGQECSKKLLDLLKSIEENSDVINSEKLLIEIRKITEKIVEKFYAIGIIPSDVYNGEGRLNKSLLFLSGRHNNYIYKEDILHPVVSALLKNVLEITQDGGHFKSDLKLGVDLFIQKHKTNNIFYSTLYQLLDIMIWCKMYIDEHQDYDYNTKFTELKCFYEGVIDIDKDNNYICGNYLLNKNYVKGKHKKGDRIRITDSKPNTFSLNSDKYPNFVIKYELIK